MFLISLLTLPKRYSLINFLKLSLLWICILFWFRKAPSATTQLTNKDVTRDNDASVVASSSYLVDPEDVVLGAGAVGQRRHPAELPVELIQGGGGVEHLLLEGLQEAAVLLREALGRGQRLLQLLLQRALQRPHPGAVCEASSSSTSVITNLYTGIIFIRRGHICFKACFKYCFAIWSKIMSRLTKTSPAVCLKWSLFVPKCYYRLKYFTIWSSSCFQNDDTSGLCCFNKSKWCRPFIKFFGSPDLVCLLFLILYLYLTILFVLPWFSVNSVFKGAI